jgi:alcohol dehydrogenase
MTGYESLARVAHVGEGVDTALLGKRVLATYGHRTAALLDAEDCILVPDEIPDEVALLAILSNDASKGVGKLALGPTSKVLITGAGTLGLLALHRLRWLGVEVVDVVEPLPARRDLALRLGARAALAPDEPPVTPYDAGIEGSARASAFSLLQQVIKRGGQLCVLSDGNVEPLVLEPHFHERELSVVASSDGEDYPGHAEAFWAHWRGSKAPLEALFEWRVTASELQKAFERAAAGPPPVKILVSYGD